MILFGQQKKLALIIALGIFFCMLIFYVFFQWHQDWQLTHTNTSIIVQPLKYDTALTINHLPNVHLFGKAISNGDMPITNLQLRVTGIVRQENNNKAYISMSGQPGKVYKIGDILPYGVKIYDITADSVILENNGEFEKLPLPREKLEFKSRDLKELF